MPKVRASSGTIGTTSLPICSSRSSFDSIRTNTIVVDALRRSVPLWNSSKVSPNSALIGSARDLALRHRTVQRGAALLHVLHLGAVGRRAIERRLRHFVIRNRNAEARAERLDLLFVQLLLLVGDVLAFTGFADAVALDGAGEHEGRHALGLGGALEGVVDLRPDRGRRASAS